MNYRLGNARGTRAKQERSQTDRDALATVVAMGAFVACLAALALVGTFASLSSDAAAPLAAAPRAQLDDVPSLERSLNATELATETRAESYELAPASEPETASEPELASRDSSRDEVRWIPELNAEADQPDAYQLVEVSNDASTVSTFAPPSSLPSNRSTPGARSNQIQPLGDAARADAPSPERQPDEIRRVERVASKAYAPSPSPSALGATTPERNALARSLASRLVTQRSAGVGSVAPSAYEALVAEFTPSSPIVPIATIAPSSGVRSTSYSYGGRSSIGPQTLEESSSPSLDTVNEDLSKSYERVEGSVFTIETRKRGSGRVVEETGCGFLLQYQDRLFIVTNCHVVDGASSQEDVKIYLADSRTISPIAIFLCPDYDLAALEITASSISQSGEVKLCAFGDCSSLRVAEFVIAVGSPCLLGKTVTVGNIGGLRRNYSDLKNLGIISSNRLAEYLQISAMINPGNSGGPLVNARGEVVGITTATLVTNAPTGIAFAIPINDALRIVKTTIDEGVWRPSMLGVELEVVPAAELSSYGIDRSFGAKVVKVNAHSPAERAGLKNGDVVVTFNDEPVADDSHLARLIALADATSPTTVGVLRNGEYRVLNAQLELRGAK